MTVLSDAARVRIAIDETHTNELMIVTITRIDLMIDGEPVGFSIAGQWEITEDHVRCCAVDTRDHSGSIFDLLLHADRIVAFTTEEATRIAIEGARVFLEQVLPEQLGHGIVVSGQKVISPRRRRWWRR